MWKTLDDTNMSWLDKQIVNIQWQYANITRLIRIEKSIAKGIKRWWRLRQLCKKTNKTLLRLAKERENMGVRPPPTMEELTEFKNDMGGEAILNTHYMSSVTSRTKPLNMDIDYGNR
jgi:hypothetical protein